MKIIFSAPITVGACRVISIDTEHLSMWQAGNLKATDEFRHDGQSVWYPVSKIRRGLETSRAAMGVLLSILVGHYICSFIESPLTIAFWPLSRRPEEGMVGAARNDLNRRVLPHN